MNSTARLFFGFLRVLARVLIVVALFSGYNKTLGAEPNVVSVAGGAYHSLFVLSDGSLWAMGKNTDGELGDGTTTSRITPVKILSSHVKAVAAGKNFSLFLKDDGSVWGMGANDLGQLGNGVTSKPSTSPAQIVVRGVTAIAASFDFSMFLFTDGSVWAVRKNDQGQLGDGTKIDRIKPVKTTIYDVQAIAVGWKFSLFLRKDGTVWASGENNCGEFGDGTQNDNPVPHLVVGGNDSKVGGKITGISAGMQFSLLLSEKNLPWGMGNDAYFQLGLHASTDDKLFGPIQLTPDQLFSGKFKAVAAGSNFSLFLSANGDLWVVGNNEFGQMGDGSKTEHERPVKVVAGEVRMIWAGRGNSFFAKNDGTLWAMGADDFGQLGDGSIDNKTIPVQIYPPAGSKKQ